ncbi:MAG: ribbon-helix-helix domain-containing protein [Cyanobium sp.]
MLSSPSPQAYSRLAPAFRSPRGVTITLPFATYQDLLQRADGEGRSLSNLAAFLLESSLHAGQEAAPGTLAQRQPVSNGFH